MEKKFYRCSHCGNIIELVESSGLIPVCCGDQMTLLVPNTTDAANEKHVPVVEHVGDVVTVTVGSVPHPMTAEHHISWIYLQTENGGQLKYLKVDEPAVAHFTLNGDEPVAAYEYCNLHGLWKF
ncbi:MAG: desulfoferrodoxin family protein [Oscillospiraceae bacterium]